MNIRYGSVSELEPIHRPNSGLVGSPGYLQTCEFLEARMQKKSEFHELITLLSVMYVGTCIFLYI